MGSILSWEDCLLEGMATHSGILLNPTMRSPAMHEVR